MKKTKFFMIYTVVAMALAAVIRVLQYGYIIDSEGRYANVGVFETALRYSLYALLILSAVIMAVYYFISEKKLGDKDCCVGGKPFIVLSFILAGVIMLESGVRIGRTALSFANGTLEILMPRDVITQFDWVGISGVFAALYFALLGIEMLKNTSFLATSVLGLFVPFNIYVRGVVLFFQSFKAINKSAVHLEMLMLCALALFVMSFVAVREKASVAVRRIKAVTMIFSVLSGAVVIPSVYMLITRPENVKDPMITAIFTCEILIYSLMALIAFVRINLRKIPVKADEIKRDDEKGKLDIYINEIPEEENEE